jgi:hypothetical protein
LALLTNERRTLLVAHRFGVGLVVVELPEPLPDLPACVLVERRRPTGSDCRTRALVPRELQHRDSFARTAEQERDVTQASGVGDRDGAPGVLQRPHRSVAPERRGRCRHRRRAGRVRVDRRQPEVARGGPGEVEQASRLAAVLGRVPFEQQAGVVAARLGEPTARPDARVEVLGRPVLRVGGVEIAERVQEPRAGKVGGAEACGRDGDLDAALARPVAGLEQRARQVASPDDPRRSGQLEP